MSPDYKGAIRIVLILILGGGGYVLGMMLHTFHGWISSLVAGISVAALGYAAGLLIQEGRERERVERERRGR